jgi:hypothetical protein
VDIMETYERTQEEDELRHRTPKYQPHSYSKHYFSYLIFCLQVLIVAYYTLWGSKKLAEVVTERDAASARLKELEEVEAERDTALARLDKSEEVCTGLKTVGEMMQSTLHSTREELETMRRIA